MDLQDRLSAALAGRYEIVKQIGRGGMAVVYLARDLKLERRVAIKVLRPEFSASLVADRFVQEIQIAARLEHSLIVALHESDSTDGLLWYAMPYVQGESLHQRLEREKQLPVDEAVRITCEVAEALSYAHSQGVIHRDIKPANILLSEGHPRVADFGIAKAFTEAGGPVRTATAVGIGTVGYMSPEQATGESNIDPRTDIYSLACVLYQMLAGETPYTGPTAQAIIAKQLSLPVPSVCTLRDTVPQALDEVLRRALAKVPADRFTAVADFASATRSAALAAGADSSSPSLRKWLVVGGTVTIATVLWVTSQGAADRTSDPTPVDTTRYAVLPLSPRADSSLVEMQLVHDALTRWSGIRVVDPLQVREALVRIDSVQLSERAASRIARELGAGRYIRVSVSRIRDSLRVEASLFDAQAGGTPLANHAVRMAANLVGSDSMAVMLTNHLLFRGAPPPDTRVPPGSRSLPARQAFLRGQRALETWNLPLADSAFSDAARLDTQYAQAQMWVALVRAWAGSEPARWRIAAEQAALGRDRLSARDQLLTDAILAQVRGDLSRACRSWDELANRDHSDFTVWFGLAYCNANDTAVVRDRTSPSGWRFRSSYHYALRAYQRAFELLPSILSSFRGGSYDLLRGLLYTAGNARRRGRALAPDTTRFVADAAWGGDSLVLVPYPRVASTTQQLTVLSEAHREAVHNQRILFKEIAQTWAAAFPRSADAMNALAISLAMLGDDSGLDSLRRARDLVRDPAEGLQVAGAEVWMGLAFALPSEIQRLRRVRALADSLLKSHSPADASDPLLLAGLAALTGRARLAAAYMRNLDAVRRVPVPLALRETAPALLIYAALGGPRDTLAVLEQDVSEAIEQSLLPVQRPMARAEWLARPATLAFPTHHFASLRSLSGKGYYQLLDLQAKWLTGDTVAVRHGLDGIRNARRDFLAADLALDALYPEAELFRSLGDYRAAAEWLDPTLQTLPQMAPDMLARPVSAASLVRAMALRAILAQSLGDGARARGWATPVVILWSDGDSFLQPFVRDLRKLAS